MYFWYMELILTGTGTSQGIPVIGCRCEVCVSHNTKDKRLRTSAIIRRDGKADIAIDCGPDFRYQMLRIGQSKLEHILITHEHMDHIAGIDDVRAFNFTAGLTMNIWATNRVQGRLRQHFDYAFDSNPYPGAPRIELRELNEHDIEIDGLRITPLPVNHGRWPVMGFRIGDLAYITDVSEIPEQTLGKLNGLNTLILGVLRREHHHSHFNLEEGIAIAKQINATQTYFTHLSHHMGLHETVNSQLPDQIAIGHDDLRIPLTL